MDTNIILWVTTVVLGVLGLAFATSKKEKVLNKSKWLFAIPLLAISVFFIVLQLGYLSTYGLEPFAAGVGGGEEGIGGGEEGTILCAVEDTTVTLSAIDAFTSASSGGTHRYRINGGPAKEVSDAGTFTGSPGNKLSILWGNGSSTVYFGEVSEVTIPCAGTKTFDAKTYKNGTITIRVFNEENKLIDSVGENETLGSGDTASLDMDVQGQYKYGFPHGGIIVAEYNKSSFDDVLVQLPGAIEVSTPTVHTVSGTGRTTKSFSIPAILSNEKLEGTLYLDVGDDTADAVGDTDDPVLYFYPDDYFINENTGGSFDGPAAEDEKDTQTFAHKTSFTVSVD